MFLSQMEADVFSLLPSNTTQYNLSKEEWLAMRGLAEDCSIVIKPADMGSCVVIWDRTDYLLEAEKECLKLWVWLKYIDDIFFVWTDGDNELYEFLESLSSFHPNLKFTLERSEQEINFCDVTVQLSNNKSVTDLYCKPTDCHQYLHCNSCHPEHMKKSSVYSQGLRIKRLYSEDMALSNHLKDLKSWFCGRGYPENMVTEQLERVKYRNREDLLRTNDCISKEIGVPLVVTYHPHHPSFMSISSLVQEL